MSQDHASEEREGRAMNDNRKSRVTEPNSPAVNAKAPEPSGYREQWRTAKASKAAVFWILAAAIALTILLGFRWGGWVTGAAAGKAADTMAQDAVVMRLVPICVAQFNLDPQKDEKLVELQAVTNSRQRVTYVTEQGWATMPGEETADNRVATECTRVLNGN
jgi:hypothetical protein